MTTDNLELSGHALSYIDNQRTYEPKTSYDLKLTKSAKAQVFIRDILIKENYLKSPIAALERLLGVDYQALNYQKKISSKKSEQTIA